MKTLIALAAVSVLAVSGCRHRGPDDFSSERAPSPPTGLRTQTGDNFIEILWNPNPESFIAGYNVYAGSSFQGKYQWIGSTRSTSYIDRGAVNGNTYYYAVTAVSNAAESTSFREAAASPGVASSLLTR